MYFLAETRSHRVAVLCFGCRCALIGCFQFVIQQSVLNGTNPVTTPNPDHSLPVVDLSGLCSEDQVLEYNLHTQVLPEISPVTVRIQFRCRRDVPAAVRWLQMGSIGPQFYLAASAA